MCAKVTDKPKPTLPFVEITTGEERGKFIRKIIKRKDGEEKSVLLSEDIETVNDAISDLTVGVLKNVQDDLQEVNSEDDNFRVDSVKCNVSVDIEAIKTKEHGLIIRYKTEANKTRIQVTIDSILVAKK